jgi:LemA protein
MEAPLVKGNNLQMGDLRMKTRRFVILFAVAAISLTASGCGYNTLTSKRENVKGKWANVEAQIQRRADLINNLVEAAKMAGIQEQEVFGAIAAARSRLLSATSAAPQGEEGDKTPEQKQAVIDAANSFGGTIGRLLVLQEAYPQLKSNEAFLKLQDEIAGTENRIATSRNDYNGAVQDYNTDRARFPTVITAKLFGFKEEPYFKAEEGARTVPQINANSLRQNQNK